VRLTTSPPSRAECHGNLGHTGPVTGPLYLYLFTTETPRLITAVAECASVKRSPILSSSYLRGDTQSIYNAFRVFLSRR
jgi:hypothetical protein